MRKMVKVFTAAVLIAAMLLSGCSSKTEPTQAQPATGGVPSSIPQKETTPPATTAAPTTAAPTTEAPTTEAPTTEAPTTEAPTTEAATEAAKERQMSHAFDPATNNRFTVEGIEFQIPAGWTQNDQNFLISSTAGEQAWAGYSFAEGVTATMFRSDTFRESFGESLLKAFQEDAQLQSCELTEVAGREVLRTVMTGKNNGYSLMMEVCSMMTPGESGLFSLMLAQVVTGPVDYTEDFQQILENLQDVEVPEKETKGEKESSAEKQTSHDFDPETNIRYTARGIEFQIPASWSQEDPYFYGSKEIPSFSMIYYSAADGANLKMLGSPESEQSYVDGLCEGLQGDVKVLVAEWQEIAGRKIFRTKIQGETTGLELTMDFATMDVANGDKALFVLCLGQSTNGTVDYTEDFELILQNLKNVD